MCYVGMTVPEGKGQFRGNVPDKPNARNNCELDWSMQRHGQTLDCKRWTSLLLAMKWGCTSSFVDDFMFFSTVGRIAI